MLLMLACYFIVIPINSTQLISQISHNLTIIFAVLRCPIVRLNNGKIRVRARGRIVRFNCLDGFTLVGNKYSTCVRGQWDAPIPVCVSK